MNQLQIERGLGNKCRKDSTCDRCNIPLKLSQYKDQTVFFSTNKKTFRGFYCYSCATKLNKTTSHELDDYIYNSRIYMAMEKWFF